MGLLGVLYAPFGFCLIFLLHKLLPGRYVKGYCCDNEWKPLIYKLNGILIVLTCIAIFCYLPAHIQILPYINFFESFCGANMVGLLGSYHFSKCGISEKYARCPTIDQIVNKSKIALAAPQSSFAANFYLGVEWNPRVFGVDIKILLYNIGASLLFINILSAASYQYWYVLDEHLSNAMSLYIVLFFWFLIDYVIFERIHLYTYDLFAEKIGFKLFWGCVVFYSYFYCIGIFSLVENANHDITNSNVCAIVALYFAGWCVTRLSNLQKYTSRVSSNKYFFFGLVEQKQIPGTRLLYTGWWGQARHFNYCGEIIQSIAITLPCVLVAAEQAISQGLPLSHPTVLLPMLYPIYYIILFVTRQIDDDSVCRVKYGDSVWDEYCARVPYRIVPYVW